MPFRQIPKFVNTQRKEIDPDSILLEVHLYEFLYGTNPPSSPFFREQCNLIVKVDGMVRLDSSVKNLYLSNKSFSLNYLFCVSDLS